MINEKVIEHLLDLLDEATINFHEHTHPGSEWVENVNWLVFDLRRDLDLKRMEFEGFAPYSEMKKLQARIRSLEEENIKLENELDEAPDQDEFNELVEENEDLRRRIAELEKGGQDAGMD